MQTELPLTCQLTRALGFCQTEPQLYGSPCKSMLIIEVLMFLVINVAGHNINIISLPRTEIYEMFIP
jgi:hypothetical protein